MKRFFVLLVLALISQVALSQSTHDFLIGAGFDFIKTDQNGLLQKAQFGLDVNYFVVRHFSVGGGAEVWTNKQKDSFVMGMRWYFNEKVFMRFRGLIGANDASLGLGYAYPLKTNVRLEGIGDYYFSGRALAIRAGIRIILK